MAKKRPNKKKQAVPGAQRVTAFLVDPDEITVIGKDTTDGEGHELYDERVFWPLREATVRNIMKRGVLQAVILRKNGECLECVEGKRRTLHAREAKKRLLAEGAPPLRILALVKRMDEMEAMGILISGNEHREDDDVLTKAKKCGRMLDRGVSELEIAGEFGVTQQTVKNWKKLLTCSAKVKKAVEQSKISAAAAAELSEMSREEQDTELDKLLDEAPNGKRPTAGDARGARNRRQGNDEAPILKKRILRRIVDFCDKRNDEALEKTEGITPDLLRGIRLGIGDLDPRSVKGLTWVIAEVSPKRKRETLAAP